MDEIAGSWVHALDYFLISTMISVTLWVDCATGKRKAKINGKIRILYEWNTRKKIKKNIFVLFGYRFIATENSKEITYTRSRNNKIWPNREANTLITACGQRGGTNWPAPLCHKIKELPQVREETGIECNTFINQSKAEDCVILFFI